MVAKIERTPEYLEELRRKRAEATARYRAAHPEKIKAEQKRADEQLSAERRARRQQVGYRDGRSRMSGESGRLRARIELEKGLSGLPLDELTVLADFNDPYRQDTAGGHRTGRWVGEQLDVVMPEGAIHIRGLHYRLVARGDIVMPNGKPYQNTDDRYAWLNLALKPARWLGYVSFERIIDNRNEPPLVLVPEDVERRAPTPGWGVFEYPPDPLQALDRYMPTMELMDENNPQPYRIILVGEKSSIGPELRPIAELVTAELILPSGELSDTLIYDMAQRASSDPRSSVVLYFSDFDPAGYRMPVTVSRKLQALEELHFPGLRIEVHHVALTAEIVERLALPSTPLKAGDRSAARWKDAMGHEQSEIDALMALHPGELGRLAREAVEPFFDFDLERKRQEARQHWRAKARGLLSDNPEAGAVAEAFDEASNALEALRDIQENALRAGVPEGLPSYDMPEPQPQGEAPYALFDSRESWVDQTQRLRARRSFDE